MYSVSCSGGHKRLLLHSYQQSNLHVHVVGERALLVNVEEWYVAVEGRFSVG